MEILGEENESTSIDSTKNIPNPAPALYTLFYLTKLFSIKCDNGIINCSKSSFKYFNNRFKIELFFNLLSCKKQKKLNE